MNNLLKNKLALAGIAAVIVVVGIAVFIFVQNSQKEAVVVEPEGTVEEQAIEMKPEDIGLTLEANAANTEVIMTISDVSKFDSFEYEMNYDAEENGELVSQGAIGSGEVEPGDSSISREITIGTCSSGKCKYHQGVTKISFLLRLNLKDGQTGIVTADLDLE